MIRQNREFIKYKIKHFSKRKNDMKIDSQLKIYYPLVIHTKERIFITRKDDMV